MKHIPAGVSKRTGKPYNEFWACENKETCGTTWTSPKKKKNPNVGFKQEVDQGEILISGQAEIKKKLDKIEADIKFLLDK